MKFTKVASLFAITLIFLSCDKENVKNIESIGYGSSFGMCVGYCKNSLSISNEKVIFEKSKNGSSPDTKTCTSVISVAEVNAIKASIDVNKLQSLPEIIGCPDCADGGAEWVSITTDGKTRKVVFEYGRAPEALAEAVVKLRVIKETFKDCN